VDGLARSGRYFFSSAEAREALGVSADAAKVALHRLSRQGLVASPARGYYVVVPPEYHALGCLPAEQFVPSLMERHGLRYYAGLLTAAEGPKMESFLQMELAASLAGKVDAPALGPTGAAGQPQKLLISFLLDAEGRVALVDVPYITRAQLDPARLAAVIATLPRWEFNPAVRGGQPHPVWAAQEFTFQP